MTESSNGKSDLRTAMREALAGIDEELRHRASTAACAALAGLDEFRQASTVMLYLPLWAEIDLTPAAIRCFQTRKSVCVPRVDWKRHDMDPVEITSFDDELMDVDEHGLRKPRRSRPLLPALIDLVAVPGLAFDAEGHRLGRGGGYYDRFLTRLRRSATTVGMAFDRQIVDNVPVNDRDIAVDVVVTDRRVIRAASRTRQ